MRRFIILAAVVSLALAFAAPVGAGGPNGIGGQTQGDVSDRLEELKLTNPLTTSLDPGLFTAGTDEVMIRLSDPSVAEQGLSGSSAQAAAETLRAQQSDLIARVLELDPDAKVLAQVQLVLNAVFFELETSVLEEIAGDPGVARIVPVGEYELDLSETVPYIGASDVQTAGFDGTGVSVAVLDSGIDYYHSALGGSGNPADYAGDDPTIVEAGTFPTAKVVDGYDFVGGAWPAGPLAPDPDPLDDGPEAGHGTHVAHIIGGTGGVAPGVELYAVKVCSSVSTACSGIALIEGMEFAVSPDGDSDPSDHVDIVNMSLGAIYGQAFDDDLSEAVDNATAVGVLTVAAAGNDSDKPYVTGTPAAAPTALSVAQTQVPSANLQLITVDDVDYPAVFQPWSVPLVAQIGPSPVQYGDGSGGNLNGCAPFTAGSLTGKIVLVDRGACNFTLKIKNIGDAGGEAGIIGLVAPGGPFSGGDGGDGPITIPGYMISQADSNAIKAAIADGGAVGVIDPTNQLPLVGQMVGGSARGPSMQFNNLIKPEIGAPGASVSAIAGTGTDTGPFGGTSGASPMVAGSAALLLDAFPGRSPMEIKSVLINTGETDIDTDPFAGLAPITRIGGGEVRVDRAHGTSAAAWDDASGNAALSFGFDDTTGTSVLTKTITVRNYSGSPITYDVNPTFRYGGDAALGAVSFSAPASIVVPANGEHQFTLEVTVDGSALKAWYGNSGFLGATAGWLTDLEFDGYIELDDTGGDTNDIHLPWHVLPRRSGDVEVTPTGPNQFGLTNNGVGATAVEAYTLLATSDDIAEGGRGEEMPIIDLRAVGYSTFQVPAGFCGPQASFVVAFGVNTWERQTHANAPALFFFDIDVDGDFVPDYEVFNADLSIFSPSFNLSDGRNVTVVVNLDTGAASAFFFTDHETNSANTVLYACASQLGLSAGQTLQGHVAIGGAFDLYFQGAVTDFVPIQFGPGIASTPVTFQGNNSGAVVLGSGDSVTGTLSGLGTTRGALLLFRGGAPDGNEAAVIEP